MESLVFLLFVVVCFRCGWLELIKEKELENAVKVSCEPAVVGGGGNGGGELAVVVVGGGGDELVVAVGGGGGGELAVVVVGGGGVANLQKHVWRLEI